MIIIIIRRKPSSMQQAPRQGSVLCLTEYNCCLTRDTFFKTYTNKLNCLFHSSESGSYPCFSEDSDFVAVFVKTGVDVWHLKSGVDRHGSDATLIMGAHR